MDIVSKPLWQDSKQVERINLELCDLFIDPNTILIGDVDLPDEQIEQLIKGLQNLLASNFDHYANRYMESLLFIIVYLIREYYQNNVWTMIEERFYDFNYRKRKFVQSLFKEHCLLYDMPTFESEAEDGHNIVTPLICHAGIPNEFLNSFFIISDYRSASLSADMSINVDEVFQYSPVNVRRFLNSLQEDIGSFFVQWQLISDVAQASSSEEELIDVLETTFDGEKVLVPRRFLSSYIDWLSQPIELRRGQSVKRSRNIRPFIRLIDGGMALSLEIPQFEINPDYELTGYEVLHWVIGIGEKEYALQAELYFNYNLGKWFSEDIQLVLKESMFDEQSNGFSVSAFLDHSVHALYESTIPFLDSDILLFNTDGIYQESKRPTDRLVLMLPESYLVAGASAVDRLDMVNFWPSYRLFSILLSADRELVIRDKSTMRLISTITYQVRHKPELIGGARFFDNQTIYTSLPDIRVDRYTGGQRALVIRNMWDLSLHLHEDLDSSEQSVELSKHFASQYGKYEIRYIVDGRTKSRDFIFYVPVITLDQESKFWPVPHMGYESNTLRFRMPVNVAMRLDQYTVQQSQLHNDGKRVTFTSEETVTRVHGAIELDVANEPHKIPFALDSHPLVWALISNNDRHLTAEKTDRVIRESWRELNRLEEPHLFLSLGYLGAPSLIAQEVVTLPNGEVIIEREHRLHSWKKFAISLSDVLHTAYLRKNRRFTVSIRLFSPDGNLIETIPLLISQDDIRVDDLSLTEDYNRIDFTWSEEGSKIDRVIVARNVSKPWEERKIYPLLNGVTEHQLPMSLFSDGIYFVSVQAPPDESPFGNIYFIPPQLKKQNLLKLSRYSKDFYPISDLNNKLIQAWMNDEDIHVTDTVYSFRNLEDIVNLSMSYLMVRESAKQPDLDVHTEQVFVNMQQVYRFVAGQHRFSNSSIIKTLLSRDFSNDQLKDLFHLFRVTWLTADECIDIGASVYFKRISELFPSIAFQIAMTEASRTPYIERWVGESQLASLLRLNKGDDPLEHLRARIEGEISPRDWAMQPAYWPAYQDYIDYYQHHASAMYSGRRRQKMSDQEIFNAYEQEHFDVRLNLFGNTSLRLVNNLVMPGQGVENHQLLRELQSFKREHLTPLLSQYGDRYRFALDRIDEISDYETYSLELTHAVFLIMFFAVLYRHGEWSPIDTSWLRHLTTIQEEYESLYLYCLVLFEIYMMNGD